MCWYDKEFLLYKGFECLMIILMIFESKMIFKWYKIVIYIKIFN